MCIKLLRTVAGTEKVVRKCELKKKKKINPAWQDRGFESLGPLPKDSG